MKTLLMQLPMVAAMSGVFFLKMDSTLWMWATLGLVVGLAILYLDQYFMYRYYFAPEGGQNLVTRSAMFLLAFVPLSFFVVSSSGSAIGMGVVMGMMVGYCVEIVQLYRNSAAFHNWFLTGTSVQLSDQQLQYVALGSVVYTLVVTGLLLL